MSDKQQPVEIRQGSLKAAIWKNEGENGPMFNTTFSRTYRDKEGQWQETQSFRSSDLLGIAELGRSAHHRVNELKKEHYQDQDQPSRGAHKAARQPQNSSNGQSHRR